MNTILDLQYVLGDEHLVSGFGSIFVLFTPHDRPILSYPRKPSFFMFTMCFWRCFLICFQLNLVSLKVQLVSRTGAYQKAKVGNPRFPPSAMRICFPNAFLKYYLLMPSS